MGNAVGNTWLEGLYILSKYMYVHEIKKNVCLNQTDQTGESVFYLHYYTKTY